MTFRFNNNNIKLCSVSQSVISSSIHCFTLSISVTPRISHSHYYLSISISCFFSCTYRWWSSGGFLIRVGTVTFTEHYRYKLLSKTSQSRRSTSHRPRTTDGGLYVDGISLCWKSALGFAITWPLTFDLWPWNLSTQVVNICAKFCWNPFTK